MKSDQPWKRAFIPPLVQRLNELAGMDGKTEKWLTGAESAVDFLRENVGTQQIVVYAQLPHVLIHGVLAPLEQLKCIDAKELQNDFVKSDARWYIEEEWGVEGPARVFLAPPLAGLGAQMEQGEKLVFRRSWPGADHVSTEIGQRLVQSLDLHYVEERSAYCRIDDLGDVEEVIKIHDLANEQIGESVCIVTIRRDKLFEYCCVAEMGIVFYFDFTRFRPGSFTGWSHQGRFENEDRDLFYWGGVEPGVGSHINGRQIVEPPIEMDQILQRLQERYDPKKRQYATFKAIDGRTGDGIEVSCDPRGLSSYFERSSDLPFQISPAFFRAEVLHKYKADPSKYDLRDRSIYCRGAWQLETYDVNDVGQVHTYLRYLAYLPYQEQLYWQSFNEWPKGPLSRRAIETDLKGVFSKEYDPLQSLKHNVEVLDHESPAWWNPRGSDLSRVVHYPVTNSDAEWADAILALDQLIVEGLKEKELRKLAGSMDLSVEKEWRSIKVLETCLVGRGVGKDEAASVRKALGTVHNLRTIVKGHAALARKSEEAKQAIGGHGSFRAHFRGLATDCDRALRIVIASLER